MENPETIDGLIFDQDVKELYHAFKRCLTEPEQQGYFSALRTFSGERAYAEGNRGRDGDFQILCKSD